ncbi:MAG: hypothetical protein LC772_11775, partial [Chloroflexi bacterium]|nr:hypothetical protein [Chloroflexota bacterium]
PDDGNWDNHGEKQWPYTSYGTQFDSWYDTHYWDSTNGNGGSGQDTNGNPNANAAFSVPANGAPQGHPFCDTGTWVAGYRSGVSLASIQLPAEKGMLFDQQGWHDGLAQNNINLNNQIVNGARRNVCYAEGHVKFDPITIYAPTKVTGTNAPDR